MTYVDWAGERNNKPLSVSGGEVMSEVGGCYWVPASSRRLILGLFNNSLCHCKKQGPSLF